MRRRSTRWADSLRQSGFVFTEQELAILDRHGRHLNLYGITRKTDAELAAAWLKYIAYRDHLLKFDALQDANKALEERYADQRRAIAKLYREIELLKSNLEAERLLVAGMGVDFIATKGKPESTHESSPVASRICSRCRGGGGVKGQCSKCGGTGWTQ